MNHKRRENTYGLQKLRKRSARWAEVLRWLRRPHGGACRVPDAAPAPADPHVLCIPRSRLEEWGETCRLAFGKADEAPAFSLLWDCCRFYAYESGGRLVSTLLFHRAGEMGGLHEMGTLSAFRGRGIARALFRRALDDARAEGCRAAGLQASAAGQPLYESMGFRPVCRVYNYRPAP